MHGRALHLIAAATAAVPLLALLPRPAASQQEPCDTFEVQYALGATVQLSETPMGTGDGIYTVGPGSAVLRFQKKAGGSGTSVEMLKYRMHERFVIQASALFWRSTFTSVTDTVVTPNACAVAAQGALVGRTIRWNTPLSGYRTDGHVRCDGSLCGMGGAPPPGEGALHLGPTQVWFKPFDFAADMQTFTMQRTLVSRSQSPKLTASIALSGREIRRACVQVQPCP